MPFHLSRMNAFRSFLALEAQPLALASLPAALQAQHPESSYRKNGKHGNHLTRSVSPKHGKYY